MKIDFERAFLFTSTKIGGAVVQWSIVTLLKRTDRPSKGPKLVRLFTINMTSRAGDEWKSRSEISLYFNWEVSKSIYYCSVVINYNFCVFTIRRLMILMCF